MGLNFIGGERIQRGKGIGGLLRAASKLFSPITKLTKKAPSIRQNLQKNDINESAK